MAESLVHMRLVRGIIRYVEETYVASYSVAIFHDLPGLIRAEKPPHISRFVPDLYAVNAPSSIAIIGEAKTEDDVETEHSRNQLTAFLEFLALQSNGVLVLAVPWTVSATAKNLTRRLLIGTRCNKVRTIVIDDATMVSRC